MSTKNQVLRRIKYLYIIFFAIVVGSVVNSIAGRDFQAGFRDGLEATEEAKSNTKVYSVSHYTYLGANIGGGGYNIPIYTAADSSKIISGRINLFDIQVEQADKNEDLSASLLYGGLTFLVLGCYVAIFIVIFMILGSLKKSVKAGNVFSRRNIYRTRAIGILLISASILNDISIYISAKTAAKLLANTSFTPYIGFPFTFSDITMGVLVLFIAEIFAIGYRLQKEQELTI